MSDVILEYLNSEFDKQRVVMLANYPESVLPAGLVNTASVLAHKMYTMTGQPVIYQLVEEHEDYAIGLSFYCNPYLEQSIILSMPRDNAEGDGKPLFTLDMSLMNPHANFFIDRGTFINTDAQDENKYIKITRQFYDGVDGILNDSTWKQISRYANAFAPNHEMGSNLAQDEEGNQDDIIIHDLLVAMGCAVIELLNLALVSSHIPYPQEWELQDRRDKLILQLKELQKAKQNV